MRYISTRGQSKALNFEEAMLAGLAKDGGLYVPETLPVFSIEEIQSWKNFSYQELAFVILHPFIDGEINDLDLKTIINKSYSKFAHQDIAPLYSLSEHEWILELFHGPTLAFKDFALQLLGNLLDFILQKRNQKVVILGATSGDTGSAAIEGCRDCNNIDIFILHPHNKVSEVQRRQMTTVLEDNVHNIAIKGNFDDCQNLVKASFNNQSFLPEGKQLVAVNSINWARIMAQIVYYFYAALSLDKFEQKISFSVPTGNFGDIFAGYLAKKMGLPIEQLIIATNSNDILHRCLQNNDHSKKELSHSLSPSMDIMVSSNFERLLFDMVGRDGNKIVTLLNEFDAGAMILDDSTMTNIKAEFDSHRVDDEMTLEMISRIYSESNYIADPHTAIGIAAARKCNNNDLTPMVCLSTAHPSKFPESVSMAIPDYKLDLPDHMADLFDREERFSVLDNDLSKLQNKINLNI